MKHAWALGAAALLVGVVANCGGEPFSTSGDGGAPDGGDDGAGGTDPGGDGGTGGGGGLTGSGGRGGSAAGGLSSSGGKTGSKGGATSSGGVVNQGGEGGEFDTGGTNGTGGSNETGGDGAEGGEVVAVGGASGGAGGKASGGNPSGGNPSGGNSSGGNPSGGNPSGGSPSGGNPSGGTGGIIMPPSSCPPEAPQDGTLCLGAFTCSYGAHPVYYCRDLYDCEDGAWSVTPATCDDAPTCSDPELMPGDSCTEDQQTCLVSEGAYFICAETCTNTCDGILVWHLIQPPLGSTCPAFIPNRGHPCADGGTGCAYGSCASSTRQDVLCDGGEWNWTGDDCLN